MGSFDLGGLGCFVFSGSRTLTKRFGHPTAELEGRCGE